MPTKFILFCICYKAWNDEYLTWNETEYPGIKSLRIPVSEIWHPDIVVYEKVRMRYYRPCVIFHWGKGLP